MIRVDGRTDQRERRQQVRSKIIRMEFVTFVGAFIQIPAQIIRTSRRLRYRLLTYRPTLEVLLLMHDQILRPLRL